MSENIDENFSYIGIDGGIVITDCFYTPSVLEIPETINGLPVIGISDFPNYNYSVKHIIIPDSVVTIGDNLLRTFSNLRTITFGKGIRNLTPVMFSDSYRLQSINISAENEYFTVYNGVLYNKDLTEFIAYPVACGQTSYMVPKTVVTIDALMYPIYASLSISFENGHAYYVTIDGVTYTKDMKKVLFCSKDKAGSYDMPDSVAEIAENAFKNCTSLTDVIVSDNVTNIVYATFASCTSLKSISLPEGLLSIEESAFDRTLSLTSIQLPSTLETIGKTAFTESGLTSLNIPDKVSYIGKKAFYDLPISSLKLGSGLKEIDERTFSSIDIVTLTLPDEIETIGPSAFQYCRDLSGIVLPDSLTTMGSSAFYGCHSLRTLHIGSGLRVIPSTAFYETGLLSVVFPETLQYIDSYAFAETALKTVEFRNPALGIGIGAFSYSDLETLTLGDQMTQISKYAFAGTKIKVLDIPQSVTNIVYGAFVGCEDLYDISIPEGVQEIGGHVFDGTAWYNSQPDGVVYLDHALYSYKGDYWNIDTVTVRDGTTIIADYAFENCYNLSEVTLPSSVKCGTA